MTMMSFKSLFQLPKRQPKPWLVAVTLSALLAAGLVVASQDLAQLQAARGDIVHPVAAQPAGLELRASDIVAPHAGDEERSAEAEARKIASDAAQEFAAAQAERDTVPTVRALHDHVHAVLEAEIARLRSNPAAAELLEPALRHFAGRLLHQPTLRIRELGRAGNADAADAAVRALFPVAGPDQHAA